MVLGLGASALKATRDVLSTARDVRSARSRPSWPFAKFGQTLGLYSFRQGRWRQAVEYLRGPLISVRHFEIPYAYSALPSDTSGRWLDVSSPRVLPMYAAHNRSIPIEVWNPDPDDLAVTRSLARLLGLGLALHDRDVSALASMADTYRCITSVSVVEHIDGEYDDRQAIAWMAQALQPGGVLILTVPVASNFEMEYRPNPVYPTQPYTDSLGYFFQRWYDGETLKSRILSNMHGLTVRDLTFAGEKRAGIYDEYQAALRRLGNRARTRDASWYYENFREFNSWQDLPGMGVAGIVAVRD